MIGLGENGGVIVQKNITCEEVKANECSLVSRHKASRC
jgi:hypothetical protein